MELRFDDFIRERRYLLNVSVRTLDWYANCFSAWKRYATGDDPKAFVVNMRQAGVKPVSCNTFICGMNAYFRWANEPIKIGKLKDEQRIVQTFPSEAVKRLIAHRPKGANESRAHIVACTILDCGLRISEALSLTKLALDFDNLIIKVQGKGNKERLVPMSAELRKLLWRWTSRHDGLLVFATRKGTRVGLRNLERDFWVLCNRLGIKGVRCSPHTLRHTFAVNYLRSGGNAFYLQRMLGHSTLEMTNLYVRSLGIEDLKAVHNGLSILSR